MNPPDTVREAAALLGDIALCDVPLGPMTTYRVGGAARLFVRVRDEAGLERVRDAIGASGVAVLVVGKGSNLLVAERGFDGLAVALGEAFGTVTIEGPRVVAGGAALLPVLARRSATAGLTGLEWAVGVPGSVGGAVRMNAGGHGSDIAATLERVRVLDLRSGEDGEVSASTLGLSYRHSSIGPADLVLRADFGLQRGDSQVSEAKIAEIVRWRREHQPGGSNAGSVFTNPPGESAGRLIERCGLKGHRIGSAEVSTKHANFIQVDPGGSSEDVLALMKEIRHRVRDETGCTLVPETRLIGFTSTEIEL